MNWRTLLNNIVNNPIVDPLIPECLRQWNDRMCVEDKYKSIFHKKVNWKKPLTYNEKIQVYKISKKTERLSNYVDKFLVRDYIAKTIGSNYLIKVYGVYENPSDIDFNTLPKSFIIKPTHGSGWISFVKNKYKINWEKEKNKMYYWLSLNWYTITKERIYRNIRPRILIEEFLMDNKGNVPTDYKVQIFNHKPVFLFIDINRFTDHRRNYYDLEWNLLPVINVYQNTDKKIPKPRLFSEILRLSTIMGKEFKNVRADFYIHKNRIYFSELTFTRGSGLNMYDPPSYDLYYGKMFNID